MVTDKDFVDYQNLVQQRFEAMEAQMMDLMDTVEKQSRLVNQLVDGTPTSSVTTINVKGDKATGSKDVKGDKATGSKDSESAVDTVGPRPFRKLT